MTICKLCSSIPLDGDGLPTLPEGLWGHRTTWKYIHQFFHRFSDSPPTGFPFHRNLESLKQSAEECDLCRLILSSIEKAIEELRNPNPENVGRGDIDIPTKPTWDLWLTRRQELGDGFCVFTNCEDSKDFCFVAAVGICVKEGMSSAIQYLLAVLNTIGDPLQSVYAGRPVEEDPTSPKTTAIVMKWMKQCNEHPNCTAELPPLPARVIDVGDEVKGYHMKLIETKGETGRYISLSHCWGKVKQFTTTKASFANHQINIDYDHLPKSFRDAIDITRLLGVRYIWIDSICICQDDGEDWERESAKMTSVYMNSCLTIASSAAKDSSIGCFISRRPPKYIGIQYTTKQGINGELQAFLLPMRKEALPDLYIDMADNIGEVDHPLSTRAWAVQERVLPRRTLHFGKHQMYFECNEGFRGENGLHVPWRYHSIYSQERNQFGLVLSKDRDATLALWQSMLWDYGPRDLTEPSDKFPAISGIARLLAERLDDEYIAGLWRKSLLEHLLWQGLGVRRVPKYRAPSWSWASVDGTPALGIYGKWEPMAEIIDCKVELKGKNIFGEVKSGWIKLKAPLVPLILDPRVDPEGTGVPYDNNPKVRTEKGNPEGDYSRFDFAFSKTTGREEALAMVESLKGVEIFALILAKRLPEDEDSEIDYCSLIICPAEGDSSAMQRVGFLDLSPEVLGECSQLDHPEERPIITLV
jgi:hypothetical protein